MGQLPVADVSREGAKARRRFPGFAALRWILNAERAGGGSKRRWNAVPGP
jgi:hypothetical protein